MRTAIITGPPGAGKSTLATDLHDGLGDSGAHNALIEVDELERAYPPLPAERVFGHVAALSRSYREAGYSLLIVTATVEDCDCRAALLRAIGGDAPFVVVVTASPDTLERRIRAREPATWSGLDDLVAASRRLVSEVPRAVRADIVLDTDLLDRPACVRRVRAALGDL